MENYRLAPESGRVSGTSVTLYLSDAERSDFQGRHGALILTTLISEYAVNRPGADAQKYGFLSAMYRAGAPGPAAPAAASRAPAAHVPADGDPREP